MGIELNIWECAKTNIVVIIIIQLLMLLILYSIDIMIGKFCAGPGSVLRYIVHTLVGGGGLH